MQETPQKVQIQMHRYKYKYLYRYKCKRRVCSEQYLLQRGKGECQGRYKANVMRGVPQKYSNAKDAGAGCVMYDN